MRTNHLHKITKTASPLAAIALLLVVFFVFRPESTDTTTTAQAQQTQEVKIAFTGDTDVGSNFSSVLNLVKAEGAHALLVQGDMNYNGSSPSTWDSNVNAALGANFPAFVSKGNHDSNWSAWPPLMQKRIAASGAQGSIGSSPDWSITWKGIKMVFVKENGSPAFIESQLANDNSTWKICSWHKNMTAMQAGGKGDEQGWPDYNTCVKHGAIVATGHEHSYARSKTLTNPQAQTVDPTCSDPKSVCVGKGKSFVFVSGLGGHGIRVRKAPASLPHWGSIYTSTEGATWGALFIVFNVGGDPTKGRGYFKNVKGQIVDEFTITNAAAAGTIPPAGGTTPPTGGTTPPAGGGTPAGTPPFVCGGSGVGPNCPPTITTAPPVGGNPSTHPNPGGATTGPGAGVTNAPNPGGATNIPNPGGATTDPNAPNNNNNNNNTGGGTVDKGTSKKIKNLIKKLKKLVKQLKKKKKISKKKKKKIQGILKRLIKQIKKLGGNVPSSANKLVK